MVGSLMKCIGVIEICTIPVDVGFNVSSESCHVLVYALSFTDCYIFRIMNFHSRFTIVY